jgi:hypothetical protein
MRTTESLVGMSKKWFIVRFYRAGNRPGIYETLAAEKR